MGCSCDRMDDRISLHKCLDYMNSSKTSLILFYTCPTCRGKNCRYRVQVPSKEDDKEECIICMDIKTTNRICKKCQIPVCDTCLMGLNLNYVPDK